jgi:coenzyme F420-reducing hydrogenase gamma subunit
MAKKKLVIGWFTFTCSEDNTIMFVELLNRNYFEWKKVVEFKHCKVLKSKNKMGRFDVAFIEGSISTKKEEDELMELRTLSKKIVAVGACAVSGLPSGQRNSFNKSMMNKIKPFLTKHKLRSKVFPISKYVKVDDSLPGCPMIPGQFTTLLNKYLAEFKVIE